MKTKNDFPKAYIKKLLKEAYAYSLVKMNPTAPAHANKKQILKGATITKSISPVKKRPGIIPAKKK